MTGLSRGTLLAVALVAGAGLAYEVLLVRLLAVVHWQHFVAMIVSLALLGFGMSGVALTLFGRDLRRHAATAFAANALAFGLAMPAAFAIVQALPFNALEILWDPRQSVLLAATYLILAVPFFFGANCIALALMAAPEHSGRIYAADLAGAGTGAAVVTGLTVLMPLETALVLLSVLALAAAPLVVQHHRGITALLAAITMAAVLALAMAGALAPKASQYKDLSVAMSVMGAEHLEQRHGPVARLDAVGNTRIPLRHAPGLSISSRVSPPAQIGLYADAQGPMPVTDHGGDFHAPYLDALLSAAGYRLHANPAVLVAATGGGTPVLEALHHGAASVHAVELDRRMLALAAGRFAEHGGDVYAHPAVTVSIGELRSVLARDARRYDMVVLPPLESFAAASGGTRAASEAYLYTVEALDAYLAHLRPGGTLMLTRWVHLPPRGTLKLANTAIRALRERGIADPGSHLAVLRNWDTAVVLVKPDGFNEGDLAELRRFADEQRFDLAWLADLRREETDRVHAWGEPYLFDGVAALLSKEAEDFTRRYKFDLSVSTDDRPFFFRFFRWSTLPELWEQRHQGGSLLAQSGYLVTVVALAQAVVLSLLLILAPAALLKGRGRSGVFGFFGAIGLAFLMVEIVVIQKLVLVLGHPVYATAATLTAFLVFAGLGSVASSRLGGIRLRPLMLGVAAMVVFTAGLLAMLPATAGWPMPARLAVSVLAVAPVAFLMGMPFPLGIRLAATPDPRNVAWAWGVNGCASVIAALAAALIAMHLGFTWTLMVAAALYALAGGSRLGRQAP